MVFFYDSLDRLDRLIQGVVPVKDKMVSKQNCVGRASEHNVDLTVSANRTGSPGAKAVH